MVETTTSTLDSHRSTYDVRYQRLETKSKADKQDTKDRSDPPKDSDTGRDASQSISDDKSGKNSNDDNSSEALAKRAKSRERSLQAQSLWDASMAYSITEQLVRDPRSQVLHICGSFHCERSLGIPEHLTRYRPGTSLAVITIQASGSFPDFDLGKMKRQGDFVVVTDAALPRSYDASAKE